MDAVRSTLQTALAHQQAGRFAQAEALYRKVLSVQPQNADALHLLGSMGVQIGRVDEGLALIERSLAIVPTSAQYHANYGMALLQIGRQSDAEVPLRKAIELNPQMHEAHANLGVQLMQQKRTDEAIACYRRAIELSPRFANAHFNLSYALQETGDVNGAMVELRAALAIDPKLVEARMNLGNLLVDAGELDAGLAEFRKVTEIEPNYPSGQSNLLMSLHYDPRITPRELFDEHVRFGKRFADVIPRMPQRTATEADRDRRLRIGYLSPDLREHPIASFIAPVLVHHDRRLFEIFAYADVWRSDQITDRLRGQFDHWRDVARQNDEQVAQLIRADNIDILIDLAGHTNGGRPQLLARKPAPVQATWMGYPNTTGVAAVDYRITDAIVDPPGNVDALHIEKLVRLPGCFLCFAPPEEDVETVESPEVANSFVTFGSFNRLAKVSDVTIELWSRVLLRVPGSKLIIKGGGLTASTASRLLDRIAHHGIDRSRVMPLMQTARRRDHFVAMQAVDIALDTFPYNATTVTCEWLWMGVPVITLAGTSHVARVGKSLLTAAGLGESAADSPEAYVDLAIKLATDQRRLRELRQGLRERLLSSRLTNAVTFTRDLEQAYRQMWQQSQKAPR